ncbi:gamma-glutamyl-gamma-aminobutyrate hydrolase family protein [Leucobacter triazinivorans]|uniref:Gamma-glutamyl-gamma-aminobutyrate hydrolase family protein n=1 Tax=Leucobacter triazinivorans TaxID=1784719 RepID=A0A4P6KD30_9MICO|nr:gamma-glutamyl-gamma-aminobutyrate hydrolase family protein [Leucobacter triazinivorans]QBE48266.1 gamma-glutamyl-gamma-aminobutyrate hydrolase family protein [Leucobacter triazinivorans]
MTAPLIGISAPRSAEESAFGIKDSTLQVMEYADAVVSAGGRAVLLPSTAQIPEDLLAGIDGLVLSGGGDLSPSLFGEEPVEASYGISEIRDAYETALVLDAQKRKIPVLAICRGLQLINVLRGGSLHMHIDGHWQTESADQATHRVMPVAGSFFSTIVGSEAVDVNSYHHQAIDVLGSGLTPAAHDGSLIEAFEDLENDILAVQWHPEHMFAVSESQLALFRNLVERASRNEERK